MPISVDGNKIRIQMKPGDNPAEVFAALKKFLSDSMPESSVEERKEAYVSLLKALGSSIDDYLETKRDTSFVNVTKH